MTRSKTRAILVLLFPAALCLTDIAAAGDTDTGRFQLERSGDHFVRLDRQTGAMSVCDDKGGNLICRRAADERTAYDDEIDRLSDRVTALEKTAAANAGKSALPSDAEIDRSIGIMERMMKGLMGVVKEFQQESTDDKALPQKT